MDITRAKELLSTLADGMDPFTGELLPQNHVCNQPEMIRALHEILNALPSEKRKDLPRNAGKPWTDIEEEKLLDEFDSGMTISAIAKEHGRSKGAIESRLVNLGKITDTYIGKRFVKGVFSKQSHSSPWKQHITGFPRGIFRKFHNLYLSANPSIYGYVISLPFIFAYSAKLLRAFAKPTISDSFNVQITDSHSLIHFFVCFICSSEI